MFASPLSERYGLAVTAFAARRLDVSVSGWNFEGLNCLTVGQTQIFKKRRWKANILHVVLNFSTIALVSREQKRTDIGGKVE